MPNNVLMPALSPTMTEGKLVKWVKKEGDTVESGDVIAEIETDKATMEVEAVDEGVLAKIFIEEGTEGVAVNTVIGVLLEEGETMDDVDTSAPAAVAPKMQAKADAPKAAAPVATQTDSGDRIFASPLAKRLAAEKGIDLSKVKGSGPKGRIIKSDLDKAFVGASAAPASSGAPVSFFPKATVSAVAIADAFGLPYEVVPHSAMRKVIASRLLESKQTVPHYYLTIDVQLDEVMALRKKVNIAADGAYKISVNDFVVKACAVAQERVPAANVAWEDEAMLQYSRPDISVAVSTPAGLITPIVVDASNKSLKSVSIEIKELAGKAREGKLQPNEFQGGTMTVSNLGMFGIDVFTAILNPPQCAILAVGAGVKKPVIGKDGEITTAIVMTCTASLDHRAIDGATGAEFLAEFKKLIEETPHVLLM